MSLTPVDSNTSTEAEKTTDYIESQNSCSSSFSSDSVQPKYNPNKFYVSHLSESDKCADNHIDIIMKAAQSQRRVLNENIPDWSNGNSSQSSLMRVKSVSKKDVSSIL